MKKYIITLIAVILLLCSCDKNEQKETDVSDTAAEPTVTEEVIIPDTAATETESDTEVESETVPPKESDTEEITTEEDTTLPPPVEIVTPLEMFVTINEVCASNKSIFADKNGDTPDWIELYNSSDRAVNLAGYGISDDPENPFRYTFSNYLIEAHSYVLLLAAGNVGYSDGVISLPFKISADGETLTLTSPEGLTDILAVPELGEDETYGRTTDGGDLAAHLTPTPMGTNNSAVTIIKVPEPELSHTSGFYQSGFELSITVPEGCTVYYTIDGSTPTALSSVYTEPLILKNATDNPNVYSAIGGNTVNNFITSNNQDKANVIRAVAIDGEGNESSVVTSTYFIFNETQAYYYENMAVLSVCTDGSNLFDYETGIYVLGKTYDDYMNGEEYNPDTPTWARPANYFMDGIEAERPAAIEFFDNDHVFGFSQDVGIRIGGNTSQSSPQKSFKFYARSEYGKSSFDYPLFEDVSHYDTFLMRTGANDYAKTKIRDVLAQTLTEHRDFATAKWRPCVMFLNGEYWGFYMMMERYDSDYFEEYYGVNKDDVVAIKAWKVDIGNEEDDSYYYDLRRFVKNNDLTLPENYEKLCSMIDMQSYIDYVCMNVIISNNDWPGNNTECWRVKTVDPTNPYADGKWRWMSYDAERSMLLYGAGSGEDYTSNTYTKLIKTGLIFGYVYKNPDFRAQFLQTLADMLIYDFNYEKIDSYLTYFADNFDLQMQKNRNRYNTTGNYKGELDAIRKFWQNRPEYILNFTAEVFGTEAALEEMIVKADAAEGGDIMLFDYMLPMVDGRYILSVFDAPVTLTAVPKQGYSFVGWEMPDGSIRSAEEKITLEPLDVPAVKAVFEAIG